MNKRNLPIELASNVNFYEALYNMLQTSFLVIFEKLAN